MVSKPTERNCPVVFEHVAVTQKLVELIRSYACMLNASLEGQGHCRRVSVERDVSLHDVFLVRAEVRVALCAGAAEFSLARYGPDEAAAVQRAFARVAEHLGVSHALQRARADIEAGWAAGGTPAQLDVTEVGAGVSAGPSHP